MRIFNYVSPEAEMVIILLCGGDKKSQDADIERAIACFAGWKRVNGK